MSDNTELNSYSGGDVIATDDISDGGVADSAKVQRIKLGYGTDGNYTEVSQDNPIPVSDFLLEIAKENVDGHSSIAKFGENTSVGTSFEDIWDGGGTYVPPTQARLHNIASDSTDDDGTVQSSGTATGGSLTTMVDTGATFSSDGVLVGDYVLNDANCELAVVTTVEETTLTMASGMQKGGSGRVGTANASGDAYRVVSNVSTGASLFYIIGLDASHLTQEEFVVLDGTNDVASTYAFIRQFRAKVFGPNSTTAAGTISSTAQVDGTVTLRVEAGNNQTLMAIYTVPANKNGYLLSWWSTLSKKQVATTVDIHLRIGQLDKIGYLTQSRAMQSTGSSNFEYKYQIPKFIPPVTDVWVEGSASIAGVGIAAGFDIILVDI